eukprot:47829_1
MNVSVLYLILATLVNYGYSAACGTQSYNPTFDMCCDGVLNTRSGNNACCGTKAYHSAFDMCCGGILNTRGKAYHYTFDMCCVMMHVVDQKHIILHLICVVVEY